MINVDLAPDGKFGFVEFRESHRTHFFPLVKQPHSAHSPHAHSFISLGDEEICSIALTLFDKMELCGASPPPPTHPPSPANPAPTPAPTLLPPPYPPPLGRPLNVGRPRGYVEPGNAVHGIPTLSGTLPAAPVGAGGSYGLAPLGGGAPQLPPALPSAPPAAPPLQPLRCLRLDGLITEDMLTDAEYPELKEDIMSECERSGKASLITHLPPPMCHMACAFLHM